MMSSEAGTAEGQGMRKGTQEIDKFHEFNDVHIEEINEEEFIIRVQARRSQQHVCRNCRYRFSCPKSCESDEFCWGFEYKCWKAEGY
jgi:hypothetical protein